MRLEGLVVFLLALVFYNVNEFSWVLFIILLFLPDVGMIGYAINNTVGAYIYNVFHTYTIPLLLVAVSTLLKIEVLLLIGLVWSAHIGMDRALGYGLKYSTEFKDTHLGRL
ncbi:DUF4260 domain-containing protein [Ureibacillus xyleni]|nr:DUF4260 domain-containing protein [Ureibacillus xyleni]